jgi:hypothetical protein
MDIYCYYKKLIKHTGGSEKMDRKKNLYNKIKKSNYASDSVSDEDIRFLIDKCYEMIDNKVPAGDAVRLTYGCIYRKSDVRFNPQARIAELKK